MTLPKFLLGLGLCASLATLPTLAQQAPPSITDSKARALYEKAQSLYYKDRQPQQALLVWQQLTDKFPDYGEPYLRKASILVTIGDNANALQSYKTGLAKLPVEPARAGDYLLMGKLATQVGDYAAMRQAYTNYLATNPSNKVQVAQAKLQLQNCDFAAAAMANPTGAAPELLPTPLNQFRDQYFPVLTADNKALIFTVQRNPELKDRENEDIFISTLAPDGTFGAPQSISPVINSRENEGTATISGDGNTLVFTSCGRAGGIGGCDLYISRRRGDQWTPPRNMGLLVNSKAWDSQPSLSADGRTLYFSSERGGGHGGNDLYVTTLGADGTWGLARNLGPTVNTAGDDLAPFIHASGTTLYYATNGLVGLGSSDIFRTELDDKGQWSTPRIGLLPSAASTGMVVGAYVGGLGYLIPLENQEGSTIGLAIGGTVSTRTLKGVSISLVNTTSSSRGLTIGGINRTNELHGLQIGLINYAANNPKCLQYLPILNLHL